MISALLVEVVGGLVGDSTIRALPRAHRHRRLLEEVRSSAVAALGETRLPDVVVTSDGDGDADLEGAIRFALTPIARGIASSLVGGTWSHVADAARPRYAELLATSLDDLTQESALELVRATELAAATAFQFVSAAVNLPSVSLTDAEQAQLTLLSDIGNQVRLLQEANLLHPAAHLRKRFTHARDVLRQATARLYPPDLDAYEGVDIERLYIPPRLVAHDGPVAPAQLLADRRPTVVLGDPGSGKSTFLQWLAYSAGALTEAEGEDMLALRLELRLFASDVADGTLTIGEALVQTLSRDLQSRVGPEELEALRQRVRLIVLLDGLDEITQIDSRRAVVRAIASYWAAYPEDKLVITSRAIGYEHSPVPEPARIVRLSQFNLSDVADYASKWFALRPVAGTSPAGAAEAFLDETTAIADIRSNPLLLALLCALYRGRRYIPENRAAVYERCALFLFRDWDRDRQIVDSHIYDSTVEGAVEDLASWFLTHPELVASGAPVAEVRARLSEYLAEWQRLSSQDARESADSLLAYCTGRLWILTKSGTDARGLDLLGFTHRTFFEYFAALHIARTPSDIAKFTENLERLWLGGWYVVAEVAAQHRAANERGAADLIISNLVLRGVVDSTGIHADILAALLQGIRPRQQTMDLAAQFLLGQWLAPGAVKRVTLLTNSFKTAREIGGTRHAVASSLRSGIRPRKALPRRGSVTIPTNGPAEPELSEVDVLGARLRQMGMMDRGNIQAASRAIIKAAREAPTIRPLLVRGVIRGTAQDGRASELWRLVLQDPAFAELAQAASGDFVADLGLLQVGSLTFADFYRRHGPDSILTVLPESGSTILLQLLDTTDTDFHWKRDAWTEFGAVASSTPAQDPAARRVRSRMLTIYRHGLHLDGFTPWDVPTEIDRDTFIAMFSTAATTPAALPEVLRRAAGTHDNAGMSNDRIPMLGLLGLLFCRAVHAELRVAGAVYYERIRPSALVERADTVESEAELGSRIALQVASDVDDEEAVDSIPLDVPPITLLGSGEIVDALTTVLEFQSDYALNQWRGVCSSIGIDHDGATAILRWAQDWSSGARDAIGLLLSHRGLPDADTR